MKALIIENEFTIPDELEEFLKNNSELFESVDEQIAVLHRPFGDIARFIPPVDAIILKSTWMYAQQLEKFVDAFVNGLFQNKTYKFFVYDAVSGFNGFEFFSEKFEDYSSFKSNLIELVNHQGIVYDIDEKKYKQILFDQKLDKFKKI